MELSEIGPYVYDCLPNLSPVVNCTDEIRTGSVHMHGRNWTYHCCRATNREGFPPGTANQEEERCREKAVRIEMSFEFAEGSVVPGAVAGCLEFPDRVVFSTLCGTAVSLFGSLSLALTLSLGLPLSLPLPLGRMTLSLCYPLLLFLPLLLVLPLSSSQSP